MSSFSLCVQSTRREMEVHAAKVADFELKRKMKSMVVPTDDGKVRQLLRQLEHPITLFGEKEVSNGYRRIACLVCGEHPPPLPSLHAVCIVECALWRSCAAA
eukprot:364743-Chlamydomonas_euryale.AAC.107